MLFNDVHQWVNYQSMLSACVVGKLVTEFLPPKPVRKSLPQKSGWYTRDQNASHFLEDSLENFFGEESFGRIFLWEDICERIFVRILGEEFKKSYLNIDGIDLFVKILVFVKILYLRGHFYIT